MAEDALQREDVAPIREESPSEAMAENMRRAPLSQTGRSGKAADELLNCAGCKSGSSPSDEERIIRSEGSSCEKRRPDRPTGPSAKRYDAFLGALAHHAASPLYEVDVADRYSDKLAKADACIEHQEDDRSIARDITRPILDGAQA